MVHLNLFLVGTCSHKSNLAIIYYIVTEMSIITLNAKAISVTDFAAKNPMRPHNHGTGLKLWS